MNRSLIFGDIEVSKRQFYNSKNEVKLNLVDVNNIVVSNKVKGNKETSKYFIGYIHDISESVALLCIILPQMSGYIKYFENGGKNMSFKIEGDKVIRFGIKLNNYWVVNFILNQFMMTVILRPKRKHLVILLKHCLVEMKFLKKEWNILKY